MVWPDNPTLDQERWDIPLNSNLTALKAASDVNAADIVALDTRLDTAEATITSHTSSLSSQGSRLTTAEANIIINTRRPNTFAALGDSLVMNGLINTSPLSVGPANWIMWAVMKSAGTMQYVQSFGEGGQGTTYLNATYLPSVLALSPKPGYCVIEMGTNDAGVISFSTLIANLTYTYTTLLAAGITPVLCAVPPKTTAGAIPNICKLNAWMARYAYKNSLPFIDLYGLFADATTGQWASAGDTTDGTHFTGVGAKKAGDFLQAQMASYIAATNPWIAPLVQSAADTTNLVTNGLFLTDSNSDGLSDSWSQTIATTSTPSRVDPTDGITKGKWQRITSGASGTSNGLVRLTTPINVTEGDLVAVGFRLQISAASEATYRVDNSGWADWSNGSKPASQGMHLTGIIGMDLPAATFYKEFVVPAGYTSIRPGINGSGPNGYVQIAQVTMRNLTSLGIS